MAIRIDYIEDWEARLLSRLYTQFRDCSTWQAWCSILGRQAQDMEDAIQTIFSLTSIDDSQGVQLDLLGRVVGQPRLGNDDTTYRIYLRARILANNSDGSSENLYEIVRALLAGGDGNTLKITTSPIRTFVLNIVGAITATEAKAAADFINDAKEAGAKGYLEWMESDLSSMFRFDTGPGFDTGHFAGAVLT